MRFPLILLAATVFTVLTARAADEPADGPRPSKRVEEFLGPRTLAILAKADRVEVYRVKEGGKGSEQLDGYPIVDIGKPQGKEFAAKLKAVLYDEKTYDFDTAKACEFMPGVGFRVLSDEGLVDVILCFHCDEMQLYTTDGKHKDVEKKHEDFDRARPALVKLAKEAFPDDKEIQALKEKKG